MKILFSANELKIPNTDWSSVLSVFNAFVAIEKVWLYGSRAKGTAQAYSDIDLAMGGDINLAVLNDIEHALDDLLLPYKFDICILQQINNPSLLEHITRVGKLVYQAEEAE